MIRVDEHKLPQHNLPSEKFLSPKKVYLPLSQHIGKPSKELVGLGDLVEEGTLIAEPAGKVSSSLHAPKKGKVIAIDSFPHPVLKRYRSIVIECQEDEKKYFRTRDPSLLGREEILQIIENAGIVGMGGAGFPTHIKLNSPKKIDTLIINGCECEPYLACDYRLMVENNQGIFRGVELICRILQPKRVFFCIEENKPEAIKRFNSSISIKKYDLPSPQIVVLKSYYPQGGEKQLIYKVTKRKVPSGGLPFDVGCLVQNVATCFSIYQAVYYSKPLIERLVTFAGDSLLNPKNIWVKVGTLISELFEQGILQFKKEPRKVILGGLMMGIALDSLDYPILKTTSGVLFLSQDRVEQEPEQECIRCARCVDVCPMGLLPLEFVKRVKQGEFEKLDEVFVKDCIECGCCSWGCPAKIPIVHYIKVGKLYGTHS